MMITQTYTIRDPGAMMIEMTNATIVYSLIMNLHITFATVKTSGRNKMLTTITEHDIHLDITS